ncbi:hypothetical protein LOC67_21920 [Stieleria sp. JC731]|uniref:hypothetical protein n=1 Tax=Pirellulaceae TaxID=2691357 RepID=UPI001E4645B0|nr:hypothetical protein [Stieleria sp. JC731]MCC9603215.1 hypothetical protein [Stieleria sp. JC731]
MSLPFRRPSVPDPGPNPANRYGAPENFDDRTIEMLVQEVTAEVDVPTLYEPQREMMKPDPVTTVNSMPLRYEDTAIPLQPDPLYAERFNAAVSQNAQQPVAARSPLPRNSLPQPPSGITTQPQTTMASNPTISSEDAGRIAEFERRFAGTEFVDETVSELLMNPHPARALVPTAPVRSDSAPLVADEQGFRSQTTPFAVPHPQNYSTLPASAARLTDNVTPDRGGRPADQSILQTLPAGDLSVEPDAARQRHWIRQPD